MPYDALLMFSNAQAITVTAVSTDVLDLGSPSLNPKTGLALPVDHGASDANPVVVKVTTTFAGLTSLAVQLQGSNDNSTFTTIATTEAIPVARLGAGYEFGFNSLPRQTKYRYLRLNYVVTGTATAGTVTAGINTGFQTNGRF